MPTNENIDFLAKEAVLAQIDRSRHLHEQGLVGPAPAGMDTSQIKSILWRAFNAEFEDFDPMRREPSRAIADEYDDALRAFRARLGMPEQDDSSID